MSASPSTSDNRGDEPPRFPTETEIYILPGGQVIVADMPAELANPLTALGRRLDDMTGLSLRLRPLSPKNRPGSDTSG